MRFWKKALTGLSLAMAAAAPAQAAWWQAQTRHFTVYSEGNDKRLRTLAERLEKFDFLLRRLYDGVDSPDHGSPVRVYVLSSEAKVKALADNRNAAGFYTTSDRSALAVLSREEKSHKFDLGAEEVLFHEYAHHFMLHHFPAAYPAWYVEGFAEFFSVVKFPKDGSIEFGHIPLVRVPGLVTDSIYPVKNLFARNARGLSLRDGDRYYGTAWLLTHFSRYDKSGRREEIVRYINDVGKGVSDLQPDSYFAGGLDGLEKDLKAYMRRGLAASSLKAQDMNIGAVTVMPVDAAQGDLVEDELRFIHRPAREALPAIVAAIRTTAARYPGNPYALALLAEAEWQAGQQDAALAAADRAIAIDAKSARAYAVRARILLERAHDSGKEDDWKAALTSIVRANRADTEDPVPLALFYRYHAMRGGKMPDLGYDGLHKAFTILPQNPEYRFSYAHATAARGDYREASILLDPIAYSPHGSEQRDAAVRIKAGLDAQAARKAAENPAPAP